MSLHSQSQRVILWAMDIILKELAKLLVRYQVHCSAVYRILRYHYIKEAQHAFTKDGVTPSHSKVSQVTGLARRDVAKYSEESHPINFSDNNKLEAEPVEASILSMWHNNTNWIDGDGNPKALTSMGNDKNSFAFLVKKACGKIVAPSEALARLELADLIYRDEEKDLVYPKVSIYMPTTNDDNALFVRMGQLAHGIQRLIKTTLYNMSVPKDKRFYNVMWSASIKKGSRGLLWRALNQILSGGGKIASLLLSEHAVDKKEKADLKSGIYCFYFEEDENDKN